ncbi:hypothetical protein HNR42_002698 [Deinobacterium chartae]|uniref:Uncharacterized protein n=1 Tax=Deinobacterium chartae TaxID=521158 RepID=A0A841I4B9_9DEIO|nr:hypothetical protein [Deinobacterium chartae]MBB6099260.1 hypothetical protein [Deinobacterium chartae]
MTFPAAPTLTALSALAFLVSGPARAADLPAGLSGEWFNGSISMLQYYDRLKDTFTPASQAGASWEFGQDRTYTFVQVLQLSGVGCDQTVFTWHRGSFEVSGATLNIHPKRSTIEIKSGCNPTKVLKDTIKPYSVPWRLEQDNGEIVLYANERLYRSARSR